MGSGSVPKKVQHLRRPAGLPDEAPRASQGAARTRAGKLDCGAHRRHRDHHHRGHARSLGCPRYDFATAAERSSFIAAATDSTLVLTDCAVLTASSMLPPANAACALDHKDIASLKPDLAASRSMPAAAFLLTFLPRKSRRFCIAVMYPGTLPANPVHLSFSALSISSFLAAAS